MAANRFTRISGARELDQLLKGLPKKTGRKALAGAVRAGGNVIRKEARQRAPVGPSGELAKGIKVEQQKRGSATSAAFKIGPRKNTFYGLFLEFGTSRLAARPWLRPAFEASADRAVEKIGKQLGKNIEKAALKLAGPFAKSGLGRRRR